MESFNEIRRKIVTDALDRFPDHGDRTIAAYIWSQHPELWNSYENVRNTVRRFRGHLGDIHRASLKNKSYVKPVSVTRIIRDEI